MTIFSRLISYHPDGMCEDWEVPMIHAAIEDLQKKGWLEGEIIGKLRWLEHVDPSAEEEVALRNMKRMDQLVAIRMATTK